MNQNWNKKSCKYSGASATWKAMSSPASTSSSKSGISGISELSLFISLWLTRPYDLFLGISGLNFKNLI